MQIHITLTKCVDDGTTYTYITYTSASEPGH